MRRLKSLSTASRGISALYYSRNVHAFYALTIPYG